MDKSQVIKIAVAVVLLIVAISIIIWYMTSGSGGGSAPDAEGVRRQPSGAIQQMELPSRLA